MEAILIDVRSPKEFHEAALPGAINIPANACQIKDFFPYRDKHLCLICATGNRARAVQEKLLEAGWENVSVMDKQMEELNLQYTASGTWSVDRQFRLALAILIGSFLLGYTFQYGLSLIIPVILFSGLLFSVVTDNCYLKELIVRFPWNRRFGQP